MGSVWSKRPGSAHSPLVATAMQMLAGGVVLVVASIPKELIAHDEWTLLRTSPPDLTTWLWWGYLVVFGSLCGFTAYIWLLRNQPAARVATYAYVNPLVAIALGWLLLSEPIGVRTFVAAGLMLGGVAVIQLAKARKTLFTRAPIAAE
jgi:drug/metabolite transporter (DMT)-like permease